MSAKNLLEGVRVANVGVELFAESLAAQNAPVVQVDWRPPAGGDPEMIERLDRLAACDAANDIAIERLQAARPVWVDIGVSHRRWSPAWASAPSCTRALPSRGIECPVLSRAR